MAMVLRMTPELVNKANKKKLLVSAPSTDPIFPGLTTFFDEIQH